MSAHKFNYIIVGARLAGVSAAEGIREQDPQGTILILGDESCLPYHRPPLSKSLWTGAKKKEDIAIKGESFFQQRNLEFQRGVRVNTLNCDKKSVVVDSGATYTYDKLLIATGGTPRQLPIPGGDSEVVCYYRSLADYERIRAQAGPGCRAVVIGGGFIGSEMAAALSGTGTQTTVLFREKYLCARVFPASLGEAVTQAFRDHAVEVGEQEAVASIEKVGAHAVVTTCSGKKVEADLVVAGIGIEPEIELAQKGNLAIDNGLQLNGYLQASDPCVYGAGDNASVPYAVLGERRRIEHWDCALSQGKQAGRNMAGAAEPFLYLPYFFSDLFDLGYEAVGVVDPKLETIADWESENKKGVIYYLDQGKVKGVLLCNIFGKLDHARELIESRVHLSAEKVHGVLV